MGRLAIISVLTIVINLPICISLRPFAPAQGGNLQRAWLSKYGDPDTFQGIKAEPEFRTLNQFQNELIVKNGTEYVIYEDVSFVLFICQSPYPVTWTVPQMKQIPRYHMYTISSSSARISMFSANQATDYPFNKQFKSYLTLQSSGIFFSVTFICKHIEFAGNANLPESRIHVYMPRGEILDQQGQTIQVVSPSSEDDASFTPIILPCRPASPDTPVTLEKKFEKIWKQIPTNYTTFDPKIGFTIAMPRFPRGHAVLGEYRCTVNGTDIGEDTDSFVFVNVVRSNSSFGERPPKRFEPHLTVRGNAKVVVEGSSNEQIKCCTGASEKPALYMEQCDSDNLRCEILKATFSQNIQDKLLYARYDHSDSAVSDCANVHLYSNPTIIYCNGTNLDFMGIYLAVFRPNTGDVVKRMENWNLTSTDYMAKSLTAYKEVGGTAEVKLEEKMFIAVGYNTTFEKQTKKGMWSNLRFPDSDVPTYAMTETDRQDYDKSVAIAEYSRNYYFDYEPLRIMCFGLKYYYSGRARIRLNYKNGTKLILRKDFNRSYKIVYFHGGADYFRSAEDEISGVIGREVIATLDLESVDCFMPIWNSSGWDKFTYKLSVNSSYPPKLKGKEEEVVYFYLDDKNKEITWEVLEGAPRLELNVTKDGKELPRDIYEEFVDGYTNNTGSNSITIKFKPVTHDMHGLYRCTAENIRGRVVKTFKVVVEGKHGSTTAIVLSIVSVSVLTVILAAVGIKYRLQLAQIWRMRNAQL